MASEPKTVGELPDSAEVLVFRTSGTKAHIPGAEECPVQSRDDHNGTRKAVGVLWADTELCPACRGVVEYHTGEATLPTSTEVDA